jgi:molybdopterin-guanine dinucleotide biosynthesis protein A
MIQKQDITGIVLSGGKSKRMGNDKAIVQFDGKTFIQHSIDALTPLSNTVFIVSNSSEHDAFNIKRFNDIIENSGPLAGIYTGLYYSKTPYNIILSCDIPLIHNSVLEQLITQYSDEYDVVLVKSKQKTMPLIALYHKRCLDMCLRLLYSGEKRLSEFINQLHSRTIILEQNLEKHTANINTPHELKQLNYALNN